MSDNSPIQWLLTHLHLLSSLSVGDPEALDFLTKMLRVLVADPQLVAELEKRF